MNNRKDRCHGSRYDGYCSLPNSNSSTELPTPVSQSFETPFHKSEVRTSLTASRGVVCESRASASTSTLQQVRTSFEAFATLLRVWRVAATLYGQCCDDFARPHMRFFSGLKKTSNQCSAPNWRKPRTTRRMRFC